MTIHSARHLRVALKCSAAFDRAKSTVSGLGAGLALALCASQALANPAIGTVTTGSASVVAPSSSKTVVNQKSEDVVVNWSSFNIGAGQTTQFVQPNAQAIAVNRIGGNAPSQILGTLDANGRIVLINGNGMLFGKGSKVNVGSLVATSTDGSDSDVLSGKFTKAGNQNAAVVNQGRINTSQGGLVALVAPSVTNAGTVNAKFGTVAVGAANKFTIDFTGDGLVSFAAQGDVNGKASAINTGSLVGANVSLTSHAAEGLATGVVNMSGTVVAQTAHQVGGTIVLDAGDGSLSMSGKLDAAGQTGGGNIETSGHQVAISGTVTAGQNGKWKVDPENLTIDASAASTIDGALNSGTSVTEQTTSGAAAGYGNQSPGAGDIIVASSLSWTTGATLTLDSYHSIAVNAPITVVGGGGLVFTTNDGGTGGDYSFGNGAGVTYPGGPGSGASFTVNGTPYTLLYSMADVQAINASSAALDGYYALANPLDAKGIKNWVPIGTNGMGVSGPAFTGVFAGLGNTISNLNIKLPNDAYVGLFGYAGPSVIRDIGIVGGSVSGKSYVGALVGFDLDGTISDAYASGTVRAGAKSSNVGGLVGYNDGGAVSNSYATAAVDAGNGGSAFGGLVGANSGSIVGSYATGDVSGAGTSGGLAGYNNGTISASYATGTVSGFGYLGGLAGYNAGALDGDHATGAVNGTGNVIGGLVGYDTSNGPELLGSISNSYAMGSVSGSFGVGGLVGYLSGHRHKEVPTIVGSYATGPVAGGGAVGGLVGRAEVYSISDSYAVGQVSDITGVTTQNLYFGGLIGFAGGGTIGTVYATGAVTGTRQVGGLVGGLNKGKITNAYATGAVNGIEIVGGLVGNNGGTISQSYSSGTVSGKISGGMIGRDVAGGTVVDGYWDTQTSGLAGGIGDDGNGQEGNVVGLTTAQLQSGLPNGFDPSIWAENADINGGLPYLLALPPS